MHEPAWPIATAHYVWLPVEKEDAAVAAAPIRNGPRAGRNEKCPCGSGKKFKNCHRNAEMRQAGGSGADNANATDNRGTPPA